MKEQRWQEILRTITKRQQDRGVSFAEALCGETLTITTVDDATLTVTVGGSFTVVAASSRRAIMLDEEQFTLGEGPTFENSRGDLPVLAPHLGSGFHPKWPTFNSFARSHGIHACFCFPVRIGDARIGVLTLYREVAEPLSATQYADALILASLTADELIHTSTHTTNEAVSPLAVAGLSNVSEIHQAAGMIAEQFNCSLVDALVRLRAAAYARSEPISLIAKQVLQRELHLEK